MRITACILKSFFFWTELLFRAGICRSKGQATAISERPHAACRLILVYHCICMYVYVYMYVYVSIVVSSYGHNHPSARILACMSSHVPLDPAMF